MHTNTFAGRMGRWSAQHRKKAIWGWIAFVVIAFVVGNAVGTKAPTHDDYVGQSGQAEKLFDDHFAKKDTRAGHRPGAQGRQGDRRRRSHGRCSDHRRRVGQARRHERPVAL